MIVAIDGPAGAGKSSVARAVARRLGFSHLDTGAMYRGVALAALRAGIDPADEEALAALAGSVDIGLRPDAGGVRLLLDGADVTDELRSPAVSAAASSVAVNAAVRRLLVARQRAAMATGDWVADGRDIGTVVCPDAELKVYLTADVRERARRRREELATGGGPVPDIDEVAGELRVRDERDEGRAVSPLAVAADAVVVDTTDRSIDQVIERISTLIEERR